MNRLSLVSGLIALAVVTGAAHAQTVVPVPVYDATELALDRYVVVKRLGVEDWRSAFYIPAYSDETAAKEALRNEAARMGADGLINLHCMSQTDRIFKPAGYYCYGNAIKLKNEQRVPG